ncbi:hypothetical protein ABVF11_08480 [Pediococcus argentinicus]
MGFWILVLAVIGFVAACFFAVRLFQVNRITSVCLAILAIVLLVMIVRLV